MTTISTPITSTTAAASSRPKNHLWVALIIVVTALVMLAVATFAIVTTTDGKAPAVSSAMQVNTDTVVHGTTGHYVTTDGVPIVPPAAVTDADVSLDVHGGPGSAVTVAGQRLR